MRRYHVTTFGCQMNAHDSERIKGLLEELGLGEAPSQAEADVIVFNTCTVREKPDQKFAAHLAQARALKQRDSGRVIAVGGCFAEAQKERLFDLYPFVDIAFGPGSIPHLAEWLGAGGLAPRGRFAEWGSFAGDLPARRERPFQAWVQISTGCNSVCSYCIVPAVRGRERSRRPGDVLAEVERLARSGVREVTLLGQNVNSYGRDLGADAGLEFGGLLRAVAGIAGIERVRFTSPHPKDFREPVIRAMAECEAVCEHAHLPAQSGSTRILRAMRRTYGRERYLSLVERLRAAVPDLALTTDLIVGFPGESDAEFDATLDLVRQVGFDAAYMYMYSVRPGTPAAEEFKDHVPLAIKKERLARLIELQEAIGLERARAMVGRTVDVLVEDVAPRTPGDLLARTRGDRMVIIPGPPEWVGRFLRVTINEANAHTLFATAADEAAA